MGNSFEQGSSASVNGSCNGIFNSSGSIGCTNSILNSFEDIFSLGTRLLLERCSFQIKHIQSRLMGLT